VRALVALGLDRGKDLCVDDGMRIMKRTTLTRKR